MLTPDPSFASSIVTDVNSRLSSALTYIIKDVLGHPDVAEHMSVGPAVHALQALMREAAVTQNTPEIKRLFDEHGQIISHSQVSERCHLISWGPEDLTPSEMFLLQSAFNDDIGLTSQIVPPDPALVAQIQKSMALVRQTLSENLSLWWQELEILVSTVLLAEGEGPAGRFGGAAAFSAWGTVLINPVNTTPPLSLAVSLVHESSHLKLFYAYLDDEVVLNAAEERYSSPLRREGRPMNGIYHAAFVLARMVQFLTDLKASEISLEAFGAETTSALQSDLIRNTTAFEEAHSVIEKHGVLTPTGTAIMAEAAEAVANCKLLASAA